MFLKKDEKKEKNNDDKKERTRVAKPVKNDPEAESEQEKGISDI